MTFEQMQLAAPILKALARCGHHKPTAVAEDYVNRIGRTGRAGAAGTAISFASRADLPYLARIERYLGYDVPVQVIPGLEPDHSVRTQRQNGRGARKRAAGRRGAAGRGKPRSPRNG